MTTTTTSSGINCQASPRQHAFSRMGKQAVSALKYVRVWVRSPWLHVRPRVALLTGSVFVLLTLCLPTVVGSWGDSRPGTDLASGAEDTWWLVGLTGFAANGRRFYLFCLALAAFTMQFLFASALHWNLTRRRGLLTGLLAISGLAALVSTTDLFVLAAILQFDRWFSVNGDLTLLALVVMPGLLLAACFRPEFLTKKGAIFWALILASIVFPLWLGHLLLGKFYPHFEFDEDLMAVLPTLPFSLLPLGLWLRYELFGREPSRLWPNVARRLAVFYAVTVAFDLLSIVLFKFRGLISFFVGAYLTFFGYWQLKREPDASLRALSPPCAGAAT